MEEIKIKSLRDKQMEKIKKTEDFLEKKDFKNAPSTGPVMAKKKNYVKKLINFAIFFAFVFLIGGLGGVWIDRILIPNALIKYPELNQYELLKRVNERTTIVREIEEINISQEEAISEAIERVLPAVTGVLAKNTEGEFEKIGAGIVLTSDGYIIAPYRDIYALTGTNAPTIKVELRNGEIHNTKIASRNTDYGLIILKIEADNLSVIPYANTEDLRLGQKLIIIDDAIATDVISQFIEDHIAEDSTDSSFQSRIKIVQDLEESFAGAAVIDLEGKLVGVVEAEDLIIPLSEFQSFIEESIAG
ncbi:MAG: serine protease [Candidatus Pacebacteria bacterium]|nr:serine protease [Candidatus Paceibacterota bacterium]